MLIDESGRYDGSAQIKLVYLTASGGQFDLRGNLYNLPSCQEQILMTFQSRFGKAEWLQPYTEPTLIALAQQGLRQVDVMCPGFTADCLETLEEINEEVREAFLQAGGQSYRYIPCLNDRLLWIDTLGELCQRHLAGWPTGA